MLCQQMPAAVALSLAVRSASDCSCYRGQEVENAAAATRERGMRRKSPIVGSGRQVWWAGSANATHHFDNVVEVLVRRYMQRRDMTTFAVHRRIQGCNHLSQVWVVLMAGDARVGHLVVRRTGLRGGGERVHVFLGACLCLAML